MESRKLEIILHFAHDLLNVKVFGTMNPYDVVSITGGGAHKLFTTDVSMIRGSYPFWNCLMQFDVVPMHNNYTLLCEIKHRGKLFNRKIGEVKVPFTDLLAGDASGKKISYPVKTCFGRIKGEIILSHKFLEPIVISAGMNTGEVVGTSRVKKDRSRPILDNLWALDEMVPQ